MNRDKRKQVQELLDTIQKYDYGWTVKVDEPKNDDGCWFINVSYAGNNVCIQKLASSSYGANYDFGFSLIDNDTGYSDRPDCVCSHIPTLVKYVRIFMGLE